MLKQSASLTSAAAFSNTDAYARVLQDWRAWTREGILDLNIPMNYRDHGTRGSEYANWNARIAGMQFNRASAAGLGFFLNTTADTITQIRNARTNRLAGIVGFSYAVTNDAGASRASFLDALRDPNIFPSPDTVPAMPWKTADREEPRHEPRRLRFIMAKRRHHKRAARLHHVSKCLYRSRKIRHQMQNIGGHDGIKFSSLGSLNVIWSGELTTIASACSFLSGTGTAFPPTSEGLRGLSTEIAACDSSSSRGSHPEKSTRSAIELSLQPK